LIVEKNNFSQVVKSLSIPGQYGLDTETTGLEFSDRLFSIIISDDKEAYYFNFNAKPDHLGGYAPKNQIIPESWLSKLSPIFEQKGSLFFLHNAKFDMGMLDKEDLIILGTVHCTEAIARVLRNDHMRYSLKECAKREGLQKDESVDAYIKEHKLTTKTIVEGKKKLLERKHFDQIPFEIISKYAMTDAVITRQLGIIQIAEMKTIDLTTPIGQPGILPLIKNERQLTKVCHKLQTTGIKIDAEYTKKALVISQADSAKLSKKFLKDTGIEFQDSGKVFKQAFAALGVKLPLTPSGQPCTNKAVLDSLQNPLAQLVRDIRHQEKIQSTYLSSFLHFADDDGLIHANIRQAGTETGRFSYSDPNLQNIPKEDEPEDRLKPFFIRKCFVPISESYCFVPIDYKQQEFRMLLDYAGEHELIKEILAGADVHDATAKMFGGTRKQAKMLNFGLLYGMGTQTLADRLGVPFEEALELKVAYFSKLTGVKAFLSQVQRVGKHRKFIRNWFGFRNHIKDPNLAYVFPNHLIQGGCAQVLRVAMVKLDAYIVSRKLRSQMLLQVHDELLFQVHKSETKHIQEFKKIMESVYQPRNGLYLECSVEHSWKSWGKFDQSPGSP
jgi:DNA polymerase-1